MKKIHKIILIAFTILIVQWVLTVPYIYKPFSGYSAWDEGYKIGYGSYPKDCPSMLCKVHHKGFWGELFSSNSK